MSDDTQRMSALDSLALARTCLLLACAALAPQVGAQQGSLEQGRQIASQGAGAGVAACAGCHGARGEGVAAFPRLDGTGPAYLQATVNGRVLGSGR